MLYPYMKFPDGTEVCHSQIIEEDGQKKVIVHFERPNAEGDFDTARRFRYSKVRTSCLSLDNPKRLLRGGNAIL